MSENYLDNHSKFELQKLIKRKRELEFEIQNIDTENNMLNEELTKLELLFEDLQAQFDQESTIAKNWQNELDKINKSRSWRMSAPIRKIGAIFKKSNNHNISANNPSFSNKGVNHSESRIIEKKLWGGYAEYALAELINLTESMSTPINEKLRAKRALARWYYDQNQFDKAYEELKSINELKPLNHSSPDRIITEIKVLKKLGHIEVAKRKVWSAINSKGIQSELCLAMAHLTNKDEERLNWYNLIYDKHGYNTIEKINKSDSLDITNIYTPRTEVEKELERYKVSVIIPAYNAEDLIHIPINSLLNQTIQNLEIIVVDDCSTDNTAEVVSEFAKKDNRIKLIRKEKNEGAYAARNTGLKYVSGDFITVHDSDDWSHSQKIEIQLRELLNTPGAVGSISYLVRTTENITPVNAGSLLSVRYLMLNSSSLLLRKSVFDKLGGWDRVRVAGDTEFLWRVEKLYGTENVVRVEPNVPLSIALSNENSLTGTSITHVKTIMFGLRRTYRESFQWWHEKSRSEKDLFIDPEKEVRHFPCPVPNLINNTIERNYDYILVADFSMDSDLDMLEQIIDSLSNKKIAVFHWPDYEGNPFNTVADRIFNKISEHKIDILVPNEKIKTGKLLILTPNILNYSIDKTPEIKCDQAYIVSDQNISNKSKLIKEENLEKAMQIHAEWINKTNLDQIIK